MDVVYFTSLHVIHPTSEDYRAVTMIVLSIPFKSLLDNGDDDSGHSKETSK
ncbi:hypothetical protein YC2023_094600 [Brassica napus]